MALFGSARDASLVRSINRELINEFIDTEVAFYKLSLEDTRSNIYDESIVDKICWYFSQITHHTIILLFSYIIIIQLYTYIIISLSNYIII